MSYHNNSSSTPKSTAKATTSLPTTNARGQTAPEGYHYMPDGTLMSDIDHYTEECNTVYYHLFSMCHIGIEPYTFQQGSIPVWEGSANFISEDCNTKNLLHNNIDFYTSIGKPEIGQAIGVTDNVGLSCMIYVGHIPFPIVNPVKFTKLVISTNKFSDCSECVSLAIKGCTESKAVNYNSLATIDDGTCEYSNLPCDVCCIDSKGNQYTPTQPCICESGYSLSKSPCAVIDESEPCKTCCYSNTRGVYHPSNKDCSCEKGDGSSPCMEVETDVELSKCTNCCTNKSGKIFTPTRNNRYGCSCVSGSWSIPCKGIVTISEVAGSSTYVSQETDCVVKTCSSGELFDTSICSCVSTLVDSCDKKIDSGFNETLLHLSITNHLDMIYRSPNGYTNNWDGYKFKYYATTEPTYTENLCVAVENWGDVQDGYWAYVKSLKVIYTPEGEHENIQSYEASNFSGLHGWSANTLTIELDKTKGLWEAMKVWNNDTSVWTPGVFSMEYSVAYCDCYDSGVLPSLQKPISPTVTTVQHVFGGEEGIYVDKSDNLVNYKCVSGINPLVNEVQQTCQPTTDEVGDGVYDNIIACINSGCAGYMSCDGGVKVDGVKFDDDKSYSPIVMCCESLIKTSEEPLTKGICLSECVAEETWYPLYNVFHPNLMYDSLLGYMVRDLLNKINNHDCRVSKDSNEFKAEGLVGRTK